MALEVTSSSPPPMYVVFCSTGKQSSALYASELPQTQPSMQIFGHIFFEANETLPIRKCLVYLVRRRGTSHQVFSDKETCTCSHIFCCEKF